MAASVCCLPLLSSPGVVEYRRITCMVPEAEIAAQSCLGVQAGPVVDAGGIFEYARRTGMMKTATK